MKKQILNLLILLYLIFFSVACNDKGVIDLDNHIVKPGEELQEENSLVGTKWKLTAFVDVENNTRREPVFFDIPTVNFRPYSITFNTDSSLFGYSGNEMFGNYHIYNNSNSIFIYIHTMTERMGYPDEILYGESLSKVQSFIIKEGDTNILQLFYNDNKNYLEFEEVHNG